MIMRIVDVRMRIVDVRMRPFTLNIISTWHFYVKIVFRFLFLDNACL